MLAPSRCSGASPCCRLHAESLLGGWAFGLSFGLAAALTGFVGAALVNYAIAWRVSGDRLEKLLAQHTKWNAVHPGRCCTVAS